MSTDEHYESGYTIGIYIPKEASKAVTDELFDRVSKLVYGEILEGRGNWDPLVFGHAADVYNIDVQGHDCCPPHVYLSTSCFHGDHKYCKSETGLIGNKTPGVCKFCEAPCICVCHAHKKAEPVDE